MSGLGVLHRRNGRAVALAAAVLLGLAGAAGAGALEPGERAPAFTAPALDGGEPVALSAYRGKVVYLDFWASWCAPCLTSLPLLEELRRDLSSEDFQIVAVNVDKDPDQGRKFLSRVKVQYPSATDPAGRLPEAFGIKTMPTSFLIDRRGVIRHVHNGFRRDDMDSIRDRIEKLMAEEQ